MYPSLRRLLALFSRYEKFQLAIIFALNTLNGIVQALGVLSVMPFIAVLTDPAIIESHPVLSHVKAYLEIESSLTLTILLGVSALALLIIGNALEMYNYWLSLRFFNYKKFKLSARLLRFYLNQDLLSFSQRSSSEMSKNVISEVQRVLIGTLFLCVNLFASIIVAIALVAILIFVDPLVTITSAILLTLAYYLVYYFLSNRIKQLGHDYTVYETEIYSGVKHAFAFHKEMLISGTRNYFLSLFSSSAKKLGRNGVIYEFLTHVPMMFIEIFAFGLIILIAIYTAAATNSPASTLSTIAFYAFAVYRLVPALNAIIDGLEEFQYLEEGLDALLSDFDISHEKKSKETYSNASFELKDSIKIENLTFKYDEKQPAVLNDLSLVIPAGKTTCIIGPSGIGKSTFFDLLLGVLEPQQGKIYIDDELLDVHNLRSWRDCIGYVPQKTQLLSASVAANIAFGHQQHAIDYERVKWAAEIACIDDYITKKLPNAYDSLIGDGEIKMSGGQLQRIGIARSLYETPKVLFFDESTNELDIATEQRLFDNLGKLEEQTVIFISHKPSVIERADMVIDMQKELGL